MANYAIIATHFKTRSMLKSSNKFRSLILATTLISIMMGVFVLIHPYLERLIKDLNRRHFINTLKLNLNSLCLKTTTKEDVSKFAALINSDKATGYFKDKSLSTTEGLTQALQAMLEQSSDDDREIIKLLLGKLPGLATHKVTYYRDSQNIVNKSTTLLYIATLNKYYDIFSFILNLPDIEVNTEGHHMKVLHCAAFFNLSEYVDLLLKVKTININEYSYCGYSPLYFSIIPCVTTKSNQDLELKKPVYELLIKNGAYLNIIDLFGLKNQPMQINYKLSPAQEKLHDLCLSAIKEEKLEENKPSLLNLNNQIIKEYEIIKENENENKKILLYLLLCVKNTPLKAASLGMISACIVIPYILTHDILKYGIQVSERNEIKFINECVLRHNTSPEVIEKFFYKALENMRY